MLFLKVFLVPACLLAISLAGRRWGPGVAGWLAGMPVVVGPILLFLALDHGVAFTARAANASLSALCATVALTTSYAHACRRIRWPGALAIGLCAWAAVATLLSLLPASIAMSLALAVGVLLAVPHLLPADHGIGAIHRIGRIEIGLPRAVVGSAGGRPARQCQQEDPRGPRAAAAVERLHRCSSAPGRSRPNSADTREQYAANAHPAQRGAGRSRRAKSSAPRA
jgi:hypothetical protein